MLGRVVSRALLGVCVAAGAGAQSLEAVLQVAQAGQEEAAASQRRVDGLADAARSLQREYRGELQQVDSLGVYNQQLEELVASQREEIAETAAEIEEVTLVEREIMPLMSRMIDTLGRFVDADLPFLVDERRERVERLRALLLRSDVTVAEKYRRLLEAWQIEDDYGHTIEAYSGELVLDSESRTVEFLRIGRTALYYRTLDGQVSGAWDGSDFSPIDASHGAAVKQGLRIARKQAPPSLLFLPVQAATSAESP